MPESRELRYDTVVFDAYGTLLDIAMLADDCARAAPGDPEFLDAWRADKLRLTWLRTLMGNFADFDIVTADALDHVCATRNVVLSDTNRTALLRGWLHLDPFTDATETLEAIARCRRVVLSNGTRASLETALASADLIRNLELVISADEARAFKPSPLVYDLIDRHVARPRARVLFVSANDWDAAGAATAGFAVAWVNRYGTVPRPLGVSPDHEVATLADVVPLGETTTSNEQ